MEEQPHSLVPGSSAHSILKGERHPLGVMSVSLQEASPPPIRQLLLSNTVFGKTRDFHEHKAIATLLELLEMNSLIRSNPEPQQEMKHPQSPRMGAPAKAGWPEKVNPSPEHVSLPVKTPWPQ